MLFQTPICKKKWYAKTKSYDLICKCKTFKERKHLNKTITLNCRFFFQLKVFFKIFMYKYENTLDRIFPPYFFLKLYFQLKFFIVEPIWPLVKHCMCISYKNIIICTFCFILLIFFFFVRSRQSESWSSE